MRVRQHAQLHRRVRMARDLGHKEPFWVGAVIASACRCVGLSPAELRAAGERCNAMANQLELEAMKPPHPQATTSRVLTMPLDQVDAGDDQVDRKTRASGG